MNMVIVLIGNIFEYEKDKMTVSVGSGSSVSSGTGKLVTVAFENAGLLTAASQTYSYTLINQATGAVAAQGQLSSAGATLDFSNLPAGIYVLQIVTGSGIPESHKVLLK